MATTFPSRDPVVEPGPQLPQALAYRRQTGDPQVLTDGLVDVEEVGVAGVQPQLEAAQGDDAPVVGQGVLQVLHPPPLDVALVLQVLRDGVEVELLHVMGPPPVVQGIAVDRRHALGVGAVAVEVSVQQVVGLLSHAQLTDGHLRDELPDGKGGRRGYGYVNADLLGCGLFLQGDPLHDEPVAEDGVVARRVDGRLSGVGGHHPGRVAPSRRHDAVGRVGEAAMVR